jgi:hypothetical protein
LREYLVRTPAGAEVLVLVNHFKSKRGGADARRLRQATRVKEIVMHACLSIPTWSCSVTSTTPPTPTTCTSDQRHAAEGHQHEFPVRRWWLPGTFGTQVARNKIDYVLLSPSLLDLVTEGGIFRQGIFSASDRWPMFDTIKEKIHQASDHAAIWVDINLP